MTVRSPIVLLLLLLFSGGSSSPPGHPGRRGQADPQNFGCTFAATVEGAGYTALAVNGTQVRLTITPSSNYTIARAGAGAVVGYGAHRGRGGVAAPGALIRPVTYCRILLAEYETVVPLP